jgi:hypothetical protein
MPNYESQIGEYVEKIRSLKATFDRLSEAFRVDIDDLKATFDKYCADDWRRNTFGNALIRLRQITENNFHVVETLALVAVARYIFELSVWLILFDKDSRYCLIYYRELLATQLRYYQDVRDQLHREIKLLKRFEALDDHSNIAESFSAQPAMAKRYGDLVRGAMDRIDAEASRHFSMYLDDAKTNGYGFQAFHVEKKAVPQVESSIAQLEDEKLEFEKNVPKNVRDIVKGKWEWRPMSRVAGIVDEHDYIYTFASKLLHATPASLTTDYKNLEPQEICQFLRYIHVKMLEIADLASLQRECRPPQAQ